MQRGLRDLLAARADLRAEKGATKARHDGGSTDAYRDEKRAFFEALLGAPPGPRQERVQVTASDRSEPATCTFPSPCTSSSTARAVDVDEDVNVNRNVNLADLAASCPS